MKPLIRSSAARHDPTLRRRTFLASVAGAGLTATLAPTVSVASTTRRRPHTSASAVVQWNETAATALTTDAALGPPVMAVGMAYVQAAVYNAVIGIEGGDLYDWNVRGPRRASPDAAVAAAARRVLTYYFPVSATRVEAAYADALASVPDGPAKAAGVAYGGAAADRLIARRAMDGWLANVPYTRPPEPGVWRPTPPALAAYTAPWLGQMRTFLIRRHDQFRPPAPPALTSNQYARDINEVKDVGSITSTTRTAGQTDVAKFFGGNLTDQLQGAYRDHVTRHHLSAASAARYLALTNMTAADAVIVAWDAKLYYGRWRPVTAITMADTDCNPATTADPRWVPLLATPSHPDYVSGHTTVIGAVTKALQQSQHTRFIDLSITTKVPGVTKPTREYLTAGPLVADGIGARIWAGIHTRTADETGDAVGRRVGRLTASSFPCR